MSNLKRSNSLVLTDQERNPHKPFNSWAVARLEAQCLLGEWLGMTIYTFIGIGSNLAAATSSNEAGTMKTQYRAWGFATVIGKHIVRTTPNERDLPSRRSSDLPGIYISGGSSGAVLNPSPIITLTIFHGFPWRRVLQYIPIQILGASCGALLAFVVHHDSIHPLPKRRSHPHCHRRKHVHPTSRLSPRLNGDFVFFSSPLRSARRRSPHLHDHRAGRRRRETHLQEPGCTLS